MDVRVVRWVPGAEARAVLEQVLVQLGASEEAGCVLVVKDGIGAKVPPPQPSPGGSEQPEYDYP